MIPTIEEVEAAHSKETALRDVILPKVNKIADLYSQGLITTEEYFLMISQVRFTHL